VLMALAVVGCAGKKNAKSSNQAAKDGAPKIALCQQHQLNAFQTALFESAKKTADENGVELVSFSADQDAAKQISQIEQCISEGYNAILFEPVDPDGLKDVAKKAADAGVIVINVVSVCNDWEKSGISAVSVGNNVKAGENEMQHVADLLGGKGNIAILTGLSASTDARDRLTGYRNVLKNYPEIKEVVEPADCGWDIATAQSTVESWLAAHELNAIISENDSMAVGAGNAVGKNSGIIITGLDGTPDGFEAIKDGRISGTVAQDSAVMAANAVKAAVALINGEKLPEKTIITDSVWIDSSNVGNFQ